MEKYGWLTTADIAERLDVHHSTVTLWCRQGLFPNAIKGPRTGKGAIWLIPESDLEAFERPTMGYPKGRPRGDDADAGDGDQEVTT
jgi:hypothetical protein